jgi:uncharacterized protein YecT (DUF1311 family)
MFIFVAMVLAACGSGKAAEADPETCYDTAKTQAALTGCAGLRSRAAQKKLGVSFRKMMAATRDDEGRDLLVAAQRAWVAYQDAECAWSRDSVRGGSMAPMVYYECQALMTDQRTKVLDETLANEEH